MNYENIFLKFICYDCGYIFTFQNGEDPTSSSGCCKNCGSSKWQIKDLLGNIIE
jgi:hypothetical protein